MLGKFSYMEQKKEEFIELVNTLRGWAKDQTNNPPTATVKRLMGSDDVGLKFNRLLEFDHVEEAKAMLAFYHAEELRNDKMLTSASHGKDPLPVFEWIKEHITFSRLSARKDAEAALVICSYRDKLKELDWIYNNFTFSNKNDFDSPTTYTTILFHAIQWGKVELLSWIHEHFPVSREDLTQLERNIEDRPSTDPIKIFIQENIYSSDKLPMIAERVAVVLKATEEWENGERNLLPKERALRGALDVIGEQPQPHELSHKVFNALLEHNDFSVSKAQILVGFVEPELLTNEHMFASASRREQPLDFFKWLRLRIPFALGEVRDDAEAALLVCTTKGDLHAMRWIHEELLDEARPLHFQKLLSIAIQSTSLDVFLWFHSTYQVTPEDLEPLREVIDGLPQENIVKLHIQDFFDPQYHAMSMGQRVEEVLRVIENWTSEQAGLVHTGKGLTTLLRANRPIRNREQAKFSNYLFNLLLKHKDFTPAKATVLLRFVDERYLTNEEIFYSATSSPCTLELFDWINENLPFTCCLGAMKIEPTLEKCVRRGKMDAVKWLLDTFGFTSTSSFHSSDVLSAIISAAIQSEYLDDIDWLHRKYHLKVEDLESCKEMIQQLPEDNAVKCFIQEKIYSKAEEQRLLSQTSPEPPTLEQVVGWLRIRDFGSLNRAMKKSTTAPETLLLLIRTGKVEEAKQLVGMFLPHFNFYSNELLRTSITLPHAVDFLDWIKKTIWCGGFHTQDSIEALYLAATHSNYAGLDWIYANTQKKTKATLGEVYSRIVEHAITSAKYPILKWLHKHYPLEASDLVRWKPAIEKLHPANKMRLLCENVLEVTYCNTAAGRARIAQTIGEEPTTQTSSRSQEEQDKQSVEQLVFFIEKEQRSALKAFLNSKPLPEVFTLLLEHEKVKEAKTLVTMFPNRSFFSNKILRAASKCYRYVSLYDWIKVHVDSNFDVEDAAQALLYSFIQCYFEALDWLYENTPIKTKEALGRGLKLMLRHAIASNGSDLFEWIYQHYPLEPIDIVQWEPVVLRFSASNKLRILFEKVMAGQPQPQPQSQPSPSSSPSPQDDPQSLTLHEKCKLAVNYLLENKVSQAADLVPGSESSHNFFNFLLRNGFLEEAKILFENYPVFNSQMIDAALEHSGSYYTLAWLAGCGDVGNFVPPERRAALFLETSRRRKVLSLDFLKTIFHYDTIESLGDTYFNILYAALIEKNLEVLRWIHENYGIQKSVVERLAVPYQTALENRACRDFLYLIGIKFSNSDTESSSRESTTSTAAASTPPPQSQSSTGSDASSSTALLPTEDQEDDRLACVRPYKKGKACAMSYEEIRQALRKWFNYNLQEGYLGRAKKLYEYNQEVVNDSMYCHAVQYHSPSSLLNFLYETGKHCAEDVRNSLAVVVLNHNHHETRMTTLNWFVEHFKLETRESLGLNFLYRLLVAAVKMNDVDTLEWCRNQYGIVELDIKELEKEISASAEWVSDWFRECIPKPEPEPEPETVAAQKKEKQEEGLCSICFENELNCVLIPCWHICSCTECANKMPKCPICRRPIEKRQKVYKS